MSKKARIQKSREQLEAERRRIQSQIWAIDAEEAEKQTKPYVGRFFTFKNNYSCPEKASDYWNVYYKINKASGSSLYASRFQRDKNGIITIEPETILHIRTMSEGAREITEKQFYDRFAGVMQHAMKTTGVEGKLDVY